MRDLARFSNVRPYLCLRLFNMIQTSTKRIHVFHGQAIMDTAYTYNMNDHECIVDLLKVNSANIAISYPNWDMLMSVKEYVVSCEVLQVHCFTP